MRPGGNFDGDTNPANLNMQNTPLVVPDPSGVGDDVVVAGTYGGVNGDNTQGFIAAYQVTDGANHSVGSGAWPQFHHDPQLTGSAIAPGPAPRDVRARRGPVLHPGLLDGGLRRRHLRLRQRPLPRFHGGPASEPVVGIAPTADGGGYWEVASDGGVFAFGDAVFHGSMGGQHLAQPVVGIAPTHDDGGYWEVASDGGVFAFGDAVFHGSMGGHPLAKPVVGIAPTADGGGYWEVASDGGVFAFGDAVFHGSMGGQHLEPARGGHRPHAGGRATGRWHPTAGCSPSATPSSTDRWAASTSTGPWWASPPPPTARGTGRSPPTAASSASGTPTSAVPPGTWLSTRR